MLTDEQISAAKKSTIYSYGGAEVRHEHNDCIRIAYEWLDAQKKTLRPVNKARALKHIIEAWAGRYVSQSDVEVAAHMHPDIVGVYPRYNVSARLIEPAKARLEGIGQAFTQKNYLDRRGNESIYSMKEWNVDLWVCGIMRKGPEILSAGISKFSLPFLRGIAG